MAYKFSDDYIILIFPETNYASPITDYSSLRPLILTDTMSVPQTTAEKIPLQRKSAWREPQLSFTKGSSAASFKISGDLNEQSEFFFKALFGNDIGFPYSVTAKPFPFSFEVHQLFRDGLLNLVKGAVLEELLIEGESGGKITYEAGFRAQQETKLVSLSLLPFYSEAATFFDEAMFATPFLFSDVQVQELLNDRGVGYSSLTSFSLQLKNLFLKDEALFQNSAKKLREISHGFEGTFKAKMLWEDDKTIDEEDLLSSEKGKVVLEITSSAFKWLFTLNGVIMEDNVEEEEAYLQDVTLKLARTGSNNPAILISREEA